MSVVRFGHRSLEVTCALEVSAANDRLAEWTALRDAGRVEKLGRGVRLWLPPALRDAALELAGRESHCCPFLVFGLTSEDGRLRLDISSPVREAEPVIAALVSSERSDPS